MSQAETIKEFLVSIGFKVDEAGERKANESIARVTKGVLALGAAVEATALAVGVGVQKMAVNFDQLYFASQRIGASASDIKAFSYAVSQMGGTAEGAMQTLDNLARKMRENPGIGKHIERLTGSHIENGKLSLKNLEDMGGYLKSLIDKGQRPKAIMIAEMWGLDERTMTAMVNGVGRFAKEYKEKMKAAGLDPDKAAADAQKFMQSWRSLFATLGAIVNSALAKIMGEGGNDGLLALSKWFDKNAEWIAKALHDLAEGFIAVFRGWQEGFGQIDWKEVGKSVGEFAKDIAKLVKWFADLVTWVVKAGKAINDFGESSGLTKLLNKMAYNGPANQNPGTTGADAGGGGGPSMFSKGLNYLKYGLSGGKYGEDPKTFGKSEGAAAASPAPSNGPPLKGAHITTDLKTGIAESAKALGISKEDLATAISYETAGTFNPTKAGPVTQWGRHRGLIQWGEPQARKYGVDWNNPISSQLGKDGAVVRYLRDAGVRPGMGLLDIYSAINAGSVGRYNASDAGNGGAPGTVRDKVERQMGGHRAKAAALFREPKQIISEPQAPILAGMVPTPTAPKNPFGSINPSSFATQPLGSGAINSWHNPVTNNSISQKVDIKVEGSGDPAAVGAAVGRNVQRVNANLIRNTQGAVQ